MQVNIISDGYLECTETKSSSQ